MPRIGGKPPGSGLIAPEAASGSAQRPGPGAQGFGRWSDRVERAPVGPVGEVVPVEKKETPRSLEEGARKVANQLRAAGHEAYFAGGCVRDMLLGKPPKDYDIVTSARPEEVGRLFRRTLHIGAAFGVVKVLLGKGCEYEVATYRKDLGYSDGRRPDEIAYSQSAAEDVSRRDFTVNALLFDPVAQEVVDHVGGREDLEARVIRAVGDPHERFAEDRLRMLRAVRFAARLGFEIEAETLAAIRQHAAAITVVSMERIHVELHGIFDAPDPGRGFELLLETGLLAPILPAARSAEPERAAILSRGMARLAEVTGGLPERARHTVAWAFLLQGTPKREAEAQLRALKLSREEIRGALELLAASAALEAIPEAPSAAVTRLAIRPDVEVVQAYQRLLLGDAHPDVARFGALLDDLEARPLPPLPLLGGGALQAAGLRPSPAFKRLLEAGEVEVLERRITTKEQAVAHARRLAGLT